MGKTPSTTAYIKQDSCKVMIVDNGAHIDDILQAIGQALRGVGFAFDGEVCIIDPTDLAGE